MLRGMTGFAQASSHFKETQLNLEMRSLNHRFLECIVHSPEGMGLLEDFIKAQVKNRLSRGRVSVVLSVVNLHPKVMVDYALAESYARTLKQLNQKLRLENNLSLSQIINLEGVLRIGKAELTPEFIQAVRALTEKALVKLIAIRQKEGKAITADTLRRLEVMRKEAAKINLFSQALNKEKKAVLSKDEYGVFLKNTDIAEELTRISYHLKNFLSTIKKPSSCGKELDFIAQEIQREANTISAKAQSARISSSVVKIKSAIDQVREQVQNVE